MDKKKIKFPKEGMNREQLLTTMKSRKEQDVNWESGKAFCLVYYPGKERADLIKEAYNMFFSENALNPTTFPSLRQFEAEVIGMVADMLNGDEETTGSMTSGGTESILMAIKVAREYARKNKPGIAQPEVILPVTAHPAFQKAFHYFGVKGVTIPVGEDFRVRMDLVKEAINENTVMLVGSAPSYPHGVIDPISALSDLALENDLLLHVDACIGGFMLPFARKLGYPIYDFDFHVEGVTSISLDLHKYGYAAKGASCIMYRSAELRKHQFFVYTNWPGGIYGSPTMTGTRPGGAIAAAWAALNTIGEKGYLEMAKQSLDATKKIRDGINSIPGLQILGDPDMTLLAFNSKKDDIYAIGDQLNLKGWYFDRQQMPPSLHLTISQGHLAVADDFLNDLEHAVSHVGKFSLSKLSTSIQVESAKNLQRMLPKGMFQQLQKITQGKSQLETGKTAAMYGMMGALAGTGDLQTIVLNFLDTMNSLDY